MKVAATILVCAITLTQGKDVELNKNGCPIDFTIERLYPHENCNKFYQCYHGDLVEHKCASDLLFNEEKQECDWPHDVDCGHRIVPEPEPEDNDGNGESGGGDSGNGTCNCNPGEAPSICGRPGSDGVLVAHENCNQFYKCFAGKPVALKCSGDLLYNPYIEQCDWPNNVKCGDRVVPDCDEDNNDNGGAGGGGSGDGGNGDSGSGNGSCNCNPGEAPSICERPDSEGVLVAHENCNQFYKCNGGRPVALKCPDNLLYNPYKEQCDWPHNVECGDRVIPDCDEDNNDNGGVGDGGSGDNGNGDGGNGGGGSGNGSCNCSPGEAPSICERPGSEGVLVAHENCNQFYKCNGGRPVALKCPDNLLYNPYIEQCDWPHNVKCGDRVIPDCDEDNNDNGGVGGGGSGDNGSGDGGNGGGGSGNGSCNCSPGEAPSICERPGSEGVLVAHENCNQFYKCNGGRPVALKCPDNLLYNPYIEQCDWPHNVECGDRVIPDCDEDNNDNGGAGGGGSEDGGAGGGGSGDGGNGDSGSGNGSCNCNPGEAPSICERPDSEGVLVAHENCNQFNKCNGGRPVALKCPDNLLYNPYIEQCDWPHNVKCGDRVIPDCDEDNNDNGSVGDGGSGDNGSGDGGNGGGGSGNGSCNCSPGEAPSICERPGSEGVLVAHENCNQFYKCNGGRPVALKCPDNLLYNPYIEQCDWPHNVKCGDRVIPDCDEDNNDNGGVGGGGSGDNGSGDGGNGGGGSGNGSCNCSPGEAPSICERPGSEGVLVAHENCNQFYKCNGGRPVALKCPDNLLYNPYIEQCDWPHNVECGDRVIPDCDEDNNDNGGVGGGGSGDNGSGDGGNGGGGSGNGSCNCSPGEAPSICERPGSEGVLVAHENCNQFYKCNGGRPVALKCPDNLLYNPYIEQCDWPHNVECGDRVIPDCDEDNNDNGGVGGGGSGDGGNGGGGSENGSCNCSPGEAPSICERPGSEGVLVAHENCNQFYKCNGGRPVALKCPDNLLYNPYIEQCDWPHNVECGDRVIPDCDEDNNDNGGVGGGGSEDGGAGGGGSGDGGNEGGGSGNGSCNCNPGEAPSICERPGSEGVLIAHENCNQFYICNGGRPVTLKCPNNLLYNPYKEQCDWPHNVKCGDRVIPDGDEDNNDNGGVGGGGSGDNGSGDGGNEGGGSGNGSCNCNPGEAPSICERPGSEGVLVAHENCNQFYKCNGGRPVALKCPDNLLYNPYIEQCDWPHNVECGDRVIPDCDEDNNDNEGVGGGGSEDGGAGGGGSGDGGNEGGGSGDEGNEGGGSGNGSCNCNPGEAPSICERPGSEGVLVAHENCNQFYKCNGGRPVALKCPDNLLYNPYIEQCDWPHNVECGDRVIPDCDEDNNDNGGAGGGGSEDGGAGGGGSGDGGNEGGGSGNGSCNCNPGEAPSICERPGSEGVLIAHENCNQFYKCNGGRPVALKCPDNLLYNPYIQQCDWPNNVKCGDRIIPDGDEDSNDNGGAGGGGSGDNGSGDGGNEGDGSGNGSCNCNPGEAPSICERPGSEGVLIAHENCNQFYICNGGRPVTLKCPNNLLYNPYIEQCDWPHNVECGDRVIPDCDEDNNDNGGAGGGGSEDGGAGGGGSGDGGNEGGGSGNGSCNCNPGEAPAICERPGSEGVLIAHENCNQFYICNGGRPVTLKCPNNLLYNPYIEQCDWPNNVKCGDRIIPDGDEDSNDNGGAGGGGSEDGGAGGGGSGDGGNEGGGSGNGSCNCNPGEAPSICERPGSEGVLVAHENCNQFYICNGGRPVTLKCPNNLLYNPYIEQCDWPNNVKCGDRIIPDGDEDSNDNGGAGGGGSEDGGAGGGGSGDGGNEGGGTGNGSCNCNPGEAPSICERPGSEGVLIAHENCNQFYICNGGRPVTLKCPNNLLYNPYIEQCDWPHNVKCGDRVIPDGDEDNNDNGCVGGGGSGDGGNEGGGSGNGSCNCNPGEAPSICERPGSEGVLVAHENCNQFYKCNGGRPVALKCPDNLLYNPYIEQCDWPHNVECGDRVIPDCDEDNNDNGGAGGGGSEDGGAGGGGSGDGGNEGGGSGNGSCNCNPGEAPSICERSGSEGVLIAHENCNQFYICNGGRPVTLKCPNNLLYNPYIEQCDWPHNVKCGDRVIPDGDEDNNDNGGVGGGGSGDNGSGDGGNEGGGSGNGSCNCNPGEAPSICERPGSEGVLVAHENCNQFYKCNGGRPVALKCPDNLLYNPYIEQCDWPHNVECGDRVIPDCDEDNNDNGGAGGGGSEDGGAGGGGSGDGGNEGGGSGNGSCNCNPGEAPSICERSGSEGVLIAHENCNQFYICNGGRPVTLKCPNNLLYNPYIEQCDWPNNVKCGDRVIPDGDEDNNDNGGVGGGGSGDNGSGDGGNEGGGSGNGSCNCNPGEAPSICERPGSEGVLVAHENCNQFYKCNGGRPVALKCPDNLLYNPYIEQCDWPHNVECGDRVIPDCDEDNNDNGGAGGGGSEDGGAGGGGSGDGGNEGGGSGNGSCNCNPGEAPSICERSGSEGVLIAHENCNQFYKCNGGRPVALNCPDNLLYNPYIEQCDWPHNVECGERVIPDCDEDSNDNGGAGGDGSGDGGNDSCNCDPKEAPSICNRNGSDGQLVAHEKCNQFYNCFGGLPIALKCPGQLLYNPYKEICDWPENVNCGDRLFIGEDSEEDNTNNEQEENDDSDCDSSEALAICTNGPDGLFIPHKICNLFYICSNKEPIELTCPGYLLYDPITSRCEWPKKVDCGNRTLPEVSEVGNGNNNGVCNCDPKQAFSICSGPDSDGKLIAHENCNQFYMCSHNKPIEFTCPSNLLYDPHKELCDWTANIECEDRKRPLHLH